MKEPMPSVLTPTLIKAARALLDLNQTDLAEASGVSRKTLSLIEITKGGRMDPRRLEMLDALRVTLEDNFGVVFTFASDKTGEGVRLIAQRET